MEAEPFKITCRSILPDIVFIEKNGTILATPINGTLLHDSIALTSEGELIDVELGMTVSNSDPAWTTVHRDIRYNSEMSQEQWLFNRLKIIKDKIETETAFKKFR